jgi:hypothetical protein
MSLLATSVHGPDTVIVTVYFLYPNNDVRLDSIMQRTKSILVEQSVQPFCLLLSNLRFLAQRSLSICYKGRSTTNNIILPEIVTTPEEVKISLSINYSLCISIYSSVIACSTTIMATSSKIPNVVRLVASNVYRGQLNSQCTLPPSRHVSLRGGFSKCGTQ